jgi:hypothetical protein
LKQRARVPAVRLLCAERTDWPGVSPNWTLTPVCIMKKAFPGLLWPSNGRIKGCWAASACHSPLLQDLYLGRRVDDQQRLLIEPDPCSFGDAIRLIGVGEDVG